MLDDINIYTVLGLVIFSLILIWRVIRSFKTGFAKELHNTISIIFAIVIGYFLYKVANGFVEERYGSIVASIALLAIVLVVYKIVNIIMVAFKLFMKVPAIKLIDKFLGVFLGAVEGLVIISLLLEVLKRYVS